MSARLEELRNRKQALEAQIHEECKVAFAAETQAIFEKYPKLESFSWTQYTPHFNDGDECVFSRNEDLGFRYDGKAWEWVSRYDLNPERKAGSCPERAAAMSEVMDAVGALEDAEYKEMFGDHVKVIVSRSGVATEDYDHD